MMADAIGSAQDGLTGTSHSWGIFTGSQGTQWMPIHKVSKPDGRPCCGLSMTADDS